MIKDKIIEKRKSFIRMIEIEGKLVFEKHQTIRILRKVFTHEGEFKYEKIITKSEKKNISKLERLELITKIFKSIERNLSKRHSFTEIRDNTFIINIIPKSYITPMMTREIDYSKFKEPYQILKAFEDIEKNVNYTFFTENHFVKDIIPYVQLN